MAISSATSRNDYVGTGAVNVYAYSFMIFLNTDLVVTVADTSGVETDLVLTTDYTVSGVGSSGGGNVTLVNASQSWLTGGFLTTGYTLAIRRVRPITQTTDIRNQGSFYPETHENSFDKAVMIDQQQQDAINRSLHLPDSESVSEAITALPTAALRANKALVFDADGNPTVGTLGTTALTVSAFAETLLDDASGSAVMTTIRNSLSAETSPAASDELFMRDVSAATVDRILVSDFLKVVTTLASEASPAVDDELFIYDLSATTVDKITLANLFKVITSLSAETSPAIDDEVALYDLSGTSTDKMTLANLLKVVNGLTEDTAPDGAADFVLTYDTSAAAAKKVLVSKLGLVWTKYTKTFTDFSTAATSNSITLFTAPAGTIIHGVKIKHSTAFSGGAISAYTVSIGITGETEKYASKFNVFQAVSATTFQLSQNLASENHGSTWDVKATAISTGANLSVASAGSVDIWVLTSVAT